MNLPCQNGLLFDMADHCIGYCNGTAMPNPGAIGIGGYISHADGLLHEFVESAGTGTNNEAEYIALIRLLQLAIGKGINHLTVHLDCQLVIDQCSGRWGVRSDSLVKLRGNVEELKIGFEFLNFLWIPRTENRKANRLSEQAFLREASNTGRFAAAQDVRAVEVSPDVYIAYGTTGKYVVDLDHKTCSCPQFMNRGRSIGPCKHLIAAMYQAQNEKGGLKKIGKG